MKYKVRPLADRVRQEVQARRLNQGDYLDLSANISLPLFCINFILKKMNSDIQVEKIEIQICNHCGRDVSLGSGLFVNRIPDFNDIEIRITNNLKFPYGDFVCIECDEKTNDDIRRSIS